VLDGLCWGDKRECHSRRRFESVSQGLVSALKTSGSYWLCRMSTPTIPAVSIWKHLEGLNQPSRGAPGARILPFPRNHLGQVLENASLI
jgi:hypothetical protein